MDSNCYPNFGSAEIIKVEDMASNDLGIFGGNQNAMVRKYRVMSFEKDFSLKGFESS